ncbi:hypothetical protein FAVG1_08843 [Fusarium avenaceum]|nr:hypothetical protein FAVG1_08843 [Fusarium avenaceum]
MPPSATCPSSRRSARLRFASSLPQTPTSHPDDGYRMLRLQAALPTSDAQDSSPTHQHIELCFHSEFTPHGQRALSLHIDDLGVAVTHPTELIREPPPNGLIVNCGIVNLLDEEAEGQDEADDGQRQETQQPSTADRLHLLRTLAVLEAAIVIAGLYLIYTYTLVQSPISPMKPFPPLENIVSSTLAIPMVAYHLLFNIDRIPRAAPNSLQLLIPPPPHSITNKKTADIVKLTVDTLVNVFSDRLDTLEGYHPLDDTAVVCETYSQGSLWHLNTIVQSYKLHANIFWGKVVSDTGLYWNLDLLNLMTNLYYALRRINDQSTGSYGPATELLLKSYKKVFIALLQRFGPDILNLCDLVDYLSYDYMLRPFCWLVTINPSEYDNHDDLITDFRTNMSTWIINTETKRLAREAIQSDEIPQLLQLAYYTTGFHALASHTLDVSKRVIACQEDWAEEPRPWTGFTWFKRKTKHRYTPQNSSDLPGLVETLDQMLSESNLLDNEVICTLDAAVCFEALGTEKNWMDAMQDGGFEGAREQAEKVFELLGALEWDVDELFKGVMWWDERKKNWKGGQR